MMPVLIVLLGLAAWASNPQDPQLFRFWYGVVVILQTLGVAWLYYVGVISKRSKSFPSVKELPLENNLSKSGWRHPTTMYCDELEYASHAMVCCCMWARIGDNLHTTGVSSFWFVQGVCVAAQCMGLLLYLLDSDIVHSWIPDDRFHLDITGDPFTQGLYWMLFDLLLAWYFAVSRQKMRRKMGDQLGKGLCADWLCYAFCTSCIVVQDARQVDEMLSVRVECCFRLVRTDGPNGETISEQKYQEKLKLVGKPVLLHSADAEIPRRSSLRGSSASNSLLAVNPKEVRFGAASGQQASYPAIPEMPRSLAAAAASRAAAAGGGGDSTGGEGLTKESGVIENLRLGSNNRQSPDTVHRPHGLDPVMEGSRSAFGTSMKSSAASLAPGDQQLAGRLPSEISRVKEDIVF